ncbi:MAG: DNA translocase FtsK 4TM domain-containing protein, partial [Pseudomonadota bacterium]
MQVLGADEGRLVQPKRESVSLTDIARSLTPAPVRALGTTLLAWATIIGATCGAAALATWTVSDPSLTFAHGGETENWLGFWGASFSDLAMQFLGFASVALVALPFIWAVHTLTHRPMPHLRERALFAVLGMCAATAALGCIAVPDGWPLRESVGLGGVVGDAWLSIPRAFLGTYPGGWAAAVLFAICAVPALYCLARAANLRHGIAAPASVAEAEPIIEDEALGDDQDEGVFARISAASIGWLLHFAYVLGATFRKRRAVAPPVPQAR